MSMGYKFMGQEGEMPMSAEASHNISRTVEESFTTDFSITITAEDCTADPNDPGVSVW